MVCRFCAAAIAFMVALASNATAETTKAPVEVMHWLTSPTDSAALRVLRDAVERSGGHWIDSPMPGAGTVGWTAAVDRIVGGKPPAVFQYPAGSELIDLSKQHLLVPVPQVTAQWAHSLPPLVARASQDGGRFMAVPVDVRGENWMFYNPAVLRKVGIGVPTNWDDLLAAAKKLKAAGITPIALGGQPWQERILFDDIVLGVGGREFYRRVYERLDNTAISSSTMLKVFQVFGALRADVDKASPGRRWNQAMLMLIHGQAAFQFMGDWAKDEIVSEGLKPGVDIGCALAPEPVASYIMSIDAFAFPVTDNADVKAGQEVFARVAQDPQVQRDFAKRLGAIPARTDISPVGFDPCSVQAMAIMRAPDAQLLDPGLSLRNGLPGALDDAITEYWNDPTIAPSLGLRLFRTAVQQYK